MMSATPSTIEYLTSSLNSLSNEIPKGNEISEVGDSRAKVFAQKFNKILGITNKEFSSNIFLPEEISIDDVLYHSGGSGLAQLVLSNVNDVADAIGIEIKTNENKSATTITQNQITNQTSIQSVENAIDIVNTLSIEQSVKREIIQIMKEFETEAKNDTPNPKTLRQKFYEICKKSMDAAPAVINLANSLNVLGLMLS